MAEDGSIWLGTSSGVWVFDRAAQETQTLWRRSEGVLWAPRHSRLAEGFGGVCATSTNGPGVVLYRETQDGYQTHEFGFEMGETIAATTDLEGALWVGGRNGLFRARKKEFSTLLLDSTPQAGEITSIGESRNGSLCWAGHNTFGIWSRDRIVHLAVKSLHKFRPAMAPAWARANKSIEDLLFETPFVASSCLDRDFSGSISGFKEWNYFRASLQMADGSEVFGADDGLYHWLGKRNFQRVPEVPESKVMALAEDVGTGILWMGIDDRGLCALDADGFRVIANESEIGQVITLAGNDADELPSSGENGQSLQMPQKLDLKEAVWVGLEQGFGLVVGDRFLPCDFDATLNALPIAGLARDDCDHLWLNHSLGASRIPLSDIDRWLSDRTWHVPVVFYDVYNGLESPEVRQGISSALKTHDGRIWLLKRDGIAMIDPGALPKSRAPKVFIERLLAGGSSMPSIKSIEGVSHNYSDSGLLEIPGDLADELTIEFTTTSLHSPEKVRLEYRLDGYDAQWRLADRSRRAEYRRLAPGDYTFRVRARNHEGRWSDGDAVFAFAVIPQFWQTRPFQAACVAAGVGLLGGLVGWRLRSQRLRMDREKQSAFQRLADDLHDRVGSRLSAIMMSSKVGDVAARHARESLQEIRRVSWQADGEAGTTSALAEFIASFAAEYFSEADIRVRLDLPDSGDDVLVSEDVRHELTAMFMEACRNVVEHAAASSVEVLFRLDGGKMVLSVRDDGIGVRSPESLVSGVGRGNGLRSFQERCGRVNGICRIESPSEGGTIVEFKVPTGRASPATANHFSA